MQPRRSFIIHAPLEPDSQRECTRLGVAQNSKVLLLPFNARRRPYRGGLCLCHCKDKKRRRERDLSKGVDLPPPFTRMI